MSLRVCSTPGCPELVKAGKCAAHRRQAEQARGTRQARGYDAGHEAERKRWAPLVKAGRVTCWRCDKPIRSGEPWDLGHDDHDRSKYRGPEHQGCNRATAGR